VTGKGHKGKSERETGMGKEGKGRKERGKERKGRNIGIQHDSTKYVNKIYGESPDEL